jgi:general secretion pathway protein B
VSFILEALRRSERERQQSDVPSISAVPAAVGQRRLPGWAAAIIVLLGAALIAVAWGWWRSSARLGAPAAIVAVEAPAARAEQIPAAQPPPQAAANQPALQSAPAAAIAPGSAPIPSSVRSTSLRDVAAEVAPVTAAPPEERPAFPLATAGELRAEGVDIPALDLQLHVYSDVVEQRFVFVNGSRYREGDTLKEGPVVVEIRPEGVRLALRGREFLLPRN